ncbi:MAG: hypothetical protein ACRDXE_11300, partial [Acidimicrobiales bacterium]
MSQQVEAATEWASNAELIEACHTLGYLRDSDYVLDPTYGDGIWWNRWRPARLEANIHDNGGYDFRAMPYDDETFDAVAFDPPYVAPGGRETSTLNMHHRYGMRTTPATPRLLHEMNAAGLAECARVVKPATSREGPRPDEPDKPSGIILVKCQDYVWSQHLQMGTFWMIEAAHE